MRLDNECVNLMLKKQKNTKIFFLKRLHSLSIRDEYPIRAKQVRMFLRHLSVSTRKAQLKIRVINKKATLDKNKFQQLYVWEHHNYLIQENFIRIMIIIRYDQSVQRVRYLLYQKTLVDFQVIAKLVRNLKPKQKQNCAQHNFNFQDKYIPFCRKRKWCMDHCMCSNTGTCQQIHFGST